MRQYCVRKRLVHLHGLYSAILLFLLASLSGAQAQEPKSNQIDSRDASQQYLGVRPFESKVDRVNGRRKGSSNITGSRGQQLAHPVAEKYDPRQSVLLPAQVHDIPIGSFIPGTGWESAPALSVSATGEAHYLDQAGGQTESSSDSSASNFAPLTDDFENTGALDSGREEQRPTDITSGANSTKGIKSDSRLSFWGASSGEFEFHAYVNATNLRRQIWDASDFTERFRLRKLQARTDRDAHPALIGRRRNKALAEGDHVPRPTDPHTSSHSLGALRKSEMSRER